MAIIPKNEYPGRTDTTDPNYPQGKAQNSPLATSGTPLDASWLNDNWGFLQALLAEASITPDGNADQVGASQYLDALKAVAAESAKTAFDPESYTGQESSTDPSGRIVKTGSIIAEFAQNAQRANPVIFESAFPTGVKEVYAIYAGTTVIVTGLVTSAINETTTGFDIQTYATGTFNQRVNWFAIGY